MPRRKTKANKSTTCIGRHVRNYNTHIKHFKTVNDSMPWSSSLAICHFAMCIYVLCICVSLSISLYYYIVTTYERVKWSRLCILRRQSVVLMLVVKLRMPMISLVSKCDDSCRSCKCVLACGLINILRLFIIIITDLMSGASYFTLMCIYYVVWRYMYIRLYFGVNYVLWLFILLSFFITSSVGSP